MPVDRRLAPEDTEVVMDINAWYKDFIETHDREVEARVARDIEARVARDIEARVARDIEARLVDAQRQVEVNQLARLFERRVGRRLSGEEREMLATRIKTDGSEHLADLVLDLSGPELAAWLEKNGVARSD